MTYKEAEQNCIFQFVSGSHAYGTATENSDRDIRGVFFAPITSAFDLFHGARIFTGEIRDLVTVALRQARDNQLSESITSLEQVLNAESGDLQLNVSTVHNPHADEELQEVRKFLKLAADCNPNIIEFLYVEQGILRTSNVWKKIRANRAAFMSRLARFRFSGYAIAQLRKMDSHRQYLRNPPKDKPRLSAYGIDSQMLLSEAQLKNIKTLPKEVLKPKIVNSLDAMAEYWSAVQQWRGYQVYLQTRNPARAELEAKMGFDGKHASHLIRLMRMAREILVTGEVQVHRPDAKELLAIRQGEWTYEDCVQHAQEIEGSLEALYLTSPLPRKPDYNTISNLYVELCEERYGIKLKKS